MKLLSPRQLADTKAQELARNIARIEDSRAEAVKMNKQLAHVQADFAAMLAGQQRRWIEEERAHKEQADKMEREIKTLEKKRERALEPVILLEEKAKIKLSEANELWGRADREIALNEELSERLEEKLDDLGLREQDIIQKEHALSIKIETNKAWEKALRDEGETLNQVMQDVFLKKDTEERAITTRKNELIMLERSLEAKLERLKTTEQMLSDWKKQLESERQALDEAYKHTKLIPLVDEVKR